MEKEIDLFPAIVLLLNGLSCYSLGKVISVLIWILRDQRIDIYDVACSF